MKRISFALAALLGAAFANPPSLYHPPRYYVQHTPTLGYFQAHPTILTHHESLAYQQPVTAPYSPPPPPPPQEQQEQIDQVQQPAQNMQGMQNMQNAQNAQNQNAQNAQNPCGLPPNPSATNTTILTSECVTVCPVAPPKK
ncbi:MAG: hypothetical protein K2N20_02870 [Helicobacter sp.]|nr:hypothetical protein [Helicobacter sp.]